MEVYYPFFVWFVLFVFVLECSESSNYKSHYLSRKHNRRTQKHRQQQQRVSFQDRSERDTNAFFSAKEQQSEAFPGTEPKSRKKRGIYAWPPDSLFITQFSLEIPLYSPHGTGVPFLMEVPWEFELPNVTDISLFSPAVARSSQDKISVYQTIESLFSRFGFDGKTCMLRAVCEKAETDMVDHGLVGEVLNLVLAFSGPDQSVSSFSEDYTTAEDHGKSVGDCARKYKKCPLSLFHIFD